MHDGLIGEHRDVRDGLTPVGDHDREVGQDPARWVPAAAPADPADRGELLVQPARQTDPVGQPAEQRGARVRHHPDPVRGHVQPRPAPDTLHPESAFPLVILGPRQADSLK